jgi:hypothetical protein
VHLVGLPDVSKAEVVNVRLYGLANLSGVCLVSHLVADIADGLQSVSGCCGPWVGDSTAVVRGWVTVLLSVAAVVRGWVTVLLFEKLGAL